MRGFLQRHRMGNCHLVGRTLAHGQEVSVLYRRALGRAARERAHEDPSMTSTVSPFASLFAA